MEIAVYHGVRRVEDTTDTEILETYSNKLKAQEIVEALQRDGIHKRQIKGTLEYITYKRI